mgnify:FL=1
MELQALDLAWSLLVFIALSALPLYLVGKSRTARNFVAAETAEGSEILLVTGQDLMAPHLGTRCFKALGIRFCPDHRKSKESRAENGRAPSMTCAMVDEGIELV